MSDLQIARIEETRELARNIEIEAPQDAVVIALDAADGIYLQPGRGHSQSPIFPGSG